MDTRLLCFGVFLESLQDEIDMWEKLGMENSVLAYSIACWFLQFDFHVSNNRLVVKVAIQMAG